MPQAFAVRFLSFAVLTSNIVALGAPISFDPKDYIHIHFI
jgi:hypothetical protein